MAHILKVSPSPNWHEDKTRKINQIVLHCTGANNVTGTLAWFANPESKVSAHYVIDKNGDLYQVVNIDHIAWHCKGFNKNSIGVEIVATADDAINEAQSLTLSSLLNELLKRCGLSPEYITGHKFADKTTSHSCPAKLFGNQETAEELESWVVRHL